MKKVLTLLGLAFLVSSPAAAKNSLDSEQPAHELIEELSEILSTVKSDNPKLLQNFTKEDKEKIISEFVNSLDAGVTIGKGVEESHDTTGSYFKALPLASKGILYSRIDELTPTVYSHFAEDLEESRESSEGLKGCILDLRNCAGHNLEIAGKFVEALSELKNEDKAIPMTVLVSSNTKGSAEVISRLILENKIGIAIGTETAGEPLPGKAIELNSGETITMPQTSEEFSITDLTPVSPKLLIASNNQIDYDELADDASNGQSDLCLKRALNLLVSISVLK